LTSMRSSKKFSADGQPHGTSSITLDREIAEELLRWGSGPHQTGRAESYSQRSRSHARRRHNRYVREN
jgi:hypothetical protein